MFDPEVETWIEWFSEYGKAAIGNVLDKYPKETSGITIDAKKLYRTNPDLADDLVNHPDLMLPAAEKAVHHCDVPHSEDLKGINVRITALPNRELAIPELRKRHFGTIVTTRAVVSKATDIRPKFVEATFKCTQCPAKTSVPVNGDEINAPNECEGCGRKGPFTPLESESEMVDHQIVELTPRADEDAMNLQRSLRVHLTDDLVDTVSAGDRVKITGVLRTDAIQAGKSVDARRPKYLEGLYVETEQEDFESYDTSRVDEIKELAERDDLKQALVNSFAPNILTGTRGDTHKLAIIYQLFGGRTHHLDGGGRLRGDVNILLIGAPGVGKSQYLNQANELAPKSVKASGKGATAAGLTATATQPEFGDGWMLDAGALVMADGGLACIDEFDKMADSARKSMHEAMEDQEIPINKAGINVTLKSRTSVLAAANPKDGRFNRFDALSEQINLGEALITRFDLVFALTDTPDREMDHEIATHQYQVTKEGSATPEIEADLLREYIAYARQNVSPSFDNPETVEMLVEKYVDIRQANGDSEDSAIPVTARMNDSLRRLSEAAAKAELCETVQPRHAETAIELYEMTIGDIGLTEDGSLDAAKAAGNVPKSQQERMDAVRNAIGNEEMEIDEIHDAVELPESKVNHIIEKLKSSGDIYEPRTGIYRVA